MGVQSNDGERTRYQLMAKRPTDTDTNVNRIRSVVDNMTGLADPDDRMVEVLELLTPTPVRSVQPGKLYLFIYNAKTPNITFDQNPFIAVTDVSSGDFVDLVLTGENQDNIHGVKWELMYMKSIVLK